MKARSAINPQEIENLGNRFRLNFNVQEKVDDDNNTFFEYQSIEISELKKGVIVSNLIRLKYSLDDEIALINNYNLNNSQYQAEYEEYQNYRNNCKSIASNFSNE